MNKSGVFNAFEAVFGRALRTAPQTRAFQHSSNIARRIYLQLALKFRSTEEKRRHSNIHKEHLLSYFSMGVFTIGVLGLLQNKGLMEGQHRPIALSYYISRRFPVSCLGGKEDNANGSSEKDIKQVLELFHNWSESQLEKSENSETTPVTKGEVLQRILHGDVKHEVPSENPEIHEEHETGRAAQHSPNEAIKVRQFDELFPDMEMEDFLEKEKAYLDTLSFENLEMYTMGLIRELVLHRKYSGVKRELLCQKIKEEAYSEAYDDALETLAAEKSLYQKEVQRVSENFAIQRHEDTQTIMELSQAVCGLGTELLEGVETAAEAHNKVQDGIEHLNEEIERCLEAINEVSLNNKCLSILSEISYALENKRPIGYLISELQKVYHEEDGLGKSALQNIPLSTIERASDCPLEPMEKIKDELLRKLDSCTQMAFIPKASGVLGFLFSKLCYMMYVQQTVYPSTAEEEEAVELSQAKRSSSCNSYLALKRNLRVLGLARYYTEHGDLYSALKCLRSLEGLPLLECRSEILRIEDSLLLNQCLDAIRADIFCRLIGTA